MLVDWLVEVVDEFQLSQEALFLAVALLDRFMSVKPVMCCQLQLLGITCLWVTSKYEEVMPPSLQVRDELCYAVVCAESELVLCVTSETTVRADP